MKIAVSNLRADISVVNANAPIWLKATGVFAVLSTLLLIGLGVTGLDGAWSREIKEALDFPVMLFSSVALLIAVRSKRATTERYVWLLLLVGVLLFLLGELIWDINAYSGESNQGFTASDAVWLVGFLPFLVALGLLNRVDESEDSEQSDEGTLDVLIIIVVAITFLWQFVVFPQLSGDAMVALARVGYVAIDVGLIWLVLRPAYDAGSQWHLARLVLFLAFFARLVADFIWYSAPDEFAYIFFNSSFYFGLAIAACAAAYTPRPETYTAQYSVFPTIFLNAIVTALTVVVLVRLLLGEPSNDLVYGMVIVTSLLLVRLNMSLEHKRELLLEVSQRALTDELTGIGNRRLFDLRLREEIERAKRAEGEIGLLAIDVDGFKQINDQAGHLAGDRVLRAVAEKIVASCRAGDVACRTGGDEFSVIVCDGSDRAAEVIAERIVRAVAEIRVDLPEDGYEDVRATVSVGGTSISVSGEEQLVADADRALYRAKNAGGNRFLTYVDGPDGETSRQDKVLSGLHAGGGLGDA